MHAKKFHPIGNKEKADKMGDFETVKEAADLNEYARQFLERGREPKKYVCPVCESGKGKKKTAALSVTADGKHWRCFSCDAKGDIFDMAGILNNAETRAEQLRIVAEWAHVPLSGGENRGGGFKKSSDALFEKTKAAGESTAENTADRTADEYAEGRAKHRQYVAECARRLADLEGRGITHA